MLARFAVFGLFMPTVSVPVPGLDVNCMNEHGDSECLTWAKAGECDANPGFMRFAMSLSPQAISVANSLTVLHVPPAGGSAKRLATHVGGRIRTAQTAFPIRRQ